MNDEQIRAMFEEMCLVGDSSIVQFARAILAASDVQSGEHKLDKPAQVSGTIFGVGIRWSTVIGAAQRYHDYMQTPEKEALRIEKAQAFLDSLSAEKRSAIDEPIYQSKTTTGWIDVEEEHYDLVLDQCRRIVYLAPPSQAEKRGEDSLVELLEDARDYVDTFSGDKEDGHIAKELVAKIDAALDKSAEGAKND